MLGVVLCSLLVAPPPAPPPVPARSAADRTQSLAFARTVYELADRVATNYIRPVEMGDLIDAALCALYDEAGVTLPDDLRLAIRRAESAAERVTYLADARLALGNNTRLAGVRGLFAAVGGFNRVTDPHGRLVFPRVNSLAAVDMDFQIGLELEGVTGNRWTLYQVERQASITRVEPNGWAGPLPARGDIRSPAMFPWRVRAVVPGSPAQAAGLRPGDVITHLNGTEVTDEAASKLFNEFAYPPAVHQPGAAQPDPPTRELTIARGAKSFTVKVQGTPYTPEAVHGVYRKADGNWDAMLDPAHKLGYVRLSSMVNYAEAALTEILDDLTKRGCRGLILDVRWCPGGSIDTSAKIAGLFLREGTTIARLTSWTPQGNTSSAVVQARGTKRFLELPLVVLIGPDTAGEGELIAAALRDNDRCVVMGQRSAGWAAIQSPLEAGSAGLQYKVSTGAAIRPNGKSHQRLPDSQPTDPWGVRPDPGLEVPLTADLIAELRRAAELHALRPAGSNDALPWDDPATDPVRLAALAQLKKMLKP